MVGNPQCFWMNAVEHSGDCSLLLWVRAGTNVPACGCPPLKGAPMREAKHLLLSLESVLPKAFVSESSLETPEGDKSAILRLFAAALSSSLHLTPRPVRFSCPHHVQHGFGICTYQIQPESWGWHRTCVTRLSRTARYNTESALREARESMEHEPDSQCPRDELPHRTPQLCS